MPYSYFRVEKKITNRVNTCKHVQPFTTVGFQHYQCFTNFINLRLSLFQLLMEKKKDKRDICHSEGQAVRGTLKRLHNKQMSCKLLC